MKHLFFLVCLVFATSLSAQIEWLTWDEAISRTKENPKKILVDVYTEWCGWCKKMDKTVFRDPEIVDYINANFYAVKFDAEQRESLVYEGQQLKFNTDLSRRGAHELAYSLLDGRMSYPSIVYLDEHRDRITISPGYKAPEKYGRELRFIQDNHYKTKTYQEYISSLGEK
ncbi:DUF255 domain-containing protein [Lewinella sp. 4G2]|uniref:thioredoxin family protein n=1 Tax=Lewinella sp. 4G2 TaxID=1803372 RepID=UPI0007B4E4A3|nr:DUF255 domain-containing protein [Lewinella sp. 4G2]OAV45490.1 thioredoxin [Lewinella sp. 4G2]